MRIDHHLLKGEMVGFPIPPALFQRMHASFLRKTRILHVTEEMIVIPEKILRSRWLTEIVASFAMNEKP